MRILYFQNLQIRAKFLDRNVMVFSKMSSVVYTVFASTRRNNQARKSGKTR